MDYDAAAQLDNLEIEIGFLHGHAVAYCPQTGQMAVEPLRDHANRMHRAGRIRATSEVLGALDDLDDRPEVGAGKVVKKLKKAAKKTVAVVKTAAKKVVSSKLGKAMLVTASIATGNPAAGAAVMALGKAKSIAKTAKKKPASKQAKAVPIGAALAKKTITPKQATQKAKAAGVPASSVKSVAVALKVKSAAKKGNPKAKQLVKASEAVEAAKASPVPLAAALAAPETQNADMAPQASLPEPDYQDDDQGGEDYEQEPLEESSQEDLPEPEEYGEDDESGEYDDDGGDEYEEE